MRHSLNKNVLISTVVYLILSQSAFATNGMAPIGLGTTQKAMGGTAAATNENTMNAATNPASLANVADGWDIGAEVFMPNRQATIQGNMNPAVNGTYKGNGKDAFLIPEVGYKRKIGNSKHSVGVVVYGNGGMNTSYDKAIPLFDASPGARNAGINLEQLIVAPTWAMNINDKHSIGVSANLAYQRFSADGLGNFRGMSSDPTNLTDRGIDTSTGVGATIGWQGKLSPNVTAGLAYRSRTKMSAFDKYKGLFAEGGDLDSPAAITGGVAWQATPKTLVAADIQRIQYSKVKSMANDMTFTAPLGSNDGSGFGWKDQTIYKVGVKHQVNPKFAMLAGYNHGTNPLKSSQTLFNVLAPATVEDHITLGGEWTINKRSKVTAAYTHAFNKSVNGSNSIPPGMPPAGMGGGEANISMKQNTVGIAYSGTF